MPSKLNMPQSPGWNRVFIHLGQVIFWCFWGPVLSVMVFPWLCLGVLNVWPVPVFSGFFNALSSIGWLAFSSAVFLITAYQFGSGYYRRWQKKRKSLILPVAENFVPRVMPADWLDREIRRPRRARVQRPIGQVIRG